jgi:3-oxoadipate enol-lactonase
MRNAAGLEYEVAGAGEPVLLIHGSHVADSFLPLVDRSELVGRFRLIHYHRRGFAGSARHTGAFSIEDQARDALRPVAALGIERLHVVGHSYGAVTALQLALQEPERVHSVVLLEPPLAVAGDSEAGAMFAPLFELYRSGNARGAVDAFMSSMGGTGWQTDLEQSLPGAPEQAFRDAATFFEVEVPALQAWRFGPEQGGRIAQPVLHVLGSASGPIFAASREKLLACVPRAEDVVLPGLDHLLQLRAPELLARTIADFLAHHPLEGGESANT